MRSWQIPDNAIGPRRPGLAVRIPGEVTPEKVALLQRADRIYLDEIRAAGLYDHIWQAFAVLLPVKSVGVMGDGRTYEAVCALCAVTSIDGMTADFYPFEPTFLGRVANRIVNVVRGINRVVYDFTSKPPGTIEWEQASSGRRGKRLEHASDGLLQVDKISGRDVPEHNEVYAAVVVPENVAETGNVRPW